jgi:hypothetical protein
MITILPSELHFSPGQTINGSVTWEGLAAATDLELRMVWYTSGKGTRDHAIVARQNMGEVGESGSRQFSFLAPVYPHSFHGALVSLVWAIEAVRMPDQDSTRVDIVIAPEGKEIELLAGASRSSKP